MSLKLILESVLACAIMGKQTHLLEKGGRLAPRNVQL